MGDHAPKLHGGRQPEEQPLKRARKRAKPQAEQQAEPAQVAEEPQHKIGEAFVRIRPETKPEQDQGES